MRGAAERRGQMAIAILALFLALGGTAIAAKKYVITSTRQIKPSVLAKLEGARGPKPADAAPGPQGPTGPAGTPGIGGKAGPAGPPGVVAAYRATQTSPLEFTESTEPTLVPGLEKTVESGAYVVSANVDIVASGTTEGEFGAAKCVLTDKGSGTTRSAESEWSSPIADVPTTKFGAGVITLTLAFEEGASTLTVKCENVAHSTHVTLEAKHGSLNAVRASSVK
jgi:hypothetical protein